MAATAEKSARKPPSPRRATSAARTRALASPTCAPPKTSQRRATVAAGGSVSVAVMSPPAPPRLPPAASASAAACVRLPSLVRAGGRQREHVAERLGIERLPLREGADARVDGGEEGAQRAQAGGDERAPLAAPLGGGALGLGGGGQHLAHVPAEAALHDLLEHAPEVGGGLVVILARATDARAAHEVPVDQAADVDRDVALAVLELARNLLQRHRAVPQVEEGEDAALELREDAGGGGRRAHAVDEDRRRAIHDVLCM